MPTSSLEQTVRRLVKEALGTTKTEHVLPDDREARSRLAAERARILLAQEQQVPALRAAVEAAQQNLHAVTEEYKKRMEPHRRAVAEATERHDTTRVRLDVALSKVEAELRNTSSPVIDAFIRKLRDEHDRLRRRDPSTSRQLETDLVSGTRRIAVFSDARGLAERMKACIERIRICEKLRLEDLTDEELARRIEGMWSSLPRQGAMEFVRTEPA